MPLLLPLVTFCFLLLTSSTSLNSINLFQNLTDGNTVISKNEKFALGFFSPGSSRNRFLGVWFNTKPPYRAVWVANRETPLNDTAGVVKLDKRGMLTLVNGGGNVVWSSNSSRYVSYMNLTAQLLDNGNLVVVDGKSGVIWQSFDYPGDAFIAGMKLGKNFETGRELYQNSWKSADDPSPGEYTARFLMVHGKYPQIYIRKGSVIETRIGPFDGIEFAGQPNYKRYPVDYKFDMIINKNEMYYVYNSYNTKTALKSTLTPDGKLEILQLNIGNQEWNQILTLPIDYCDNYGLCGPFGSCSTATLRTCGCLKGFERKNATQVSSDNWISGCERETALDCGPGEGFLKFSSLKLPDTQNAVFNGSMNLQECKVACKNNCSCLAYTNPNITENGVGCLLWFGDLIDVRVYQQNGQDLYVRLAASELLNLRPGSHRKKRQIIAVSLSVSAALAVLIIILALYVWSKRKKITDFERSDHQGSSQAKSIEVPLFSLSKLSRATNNFSDDNKLGEGGFGPVYKGVLEEGQEIAIKRLSKFSRQGLDEFENEIICIAKLQHRNLVKLLGYCIQGDETMLIYEYMPNKSLDMFIFVDSAKSLLDWPHRFHIIHGIARGLLYLHQDSRLRIVHRDLKAGNILLDHDMNPKISDFGLARMFKEHESEANTKRVVGTLGYISPEYAVNGLFSVKSDIFSFGVLVLEIVSGKKNRDFVHSGHHDNLLGHAWRLFKESKPLDLVDESLRESCSVSEAIRSIHIGLLCVQQLADDRPTTLSVVAMLGGEGSLPLPKQPGFFIHGSENNTTSVLPFTTSVNGVTLSQVEGR